MILFLLLIYDPFRPKEDLRFVFDFSADGFPVVPFNPGRHSFVVLPRAINILPLQGNKRNNPIICYIKYFIHGAETI
jgi:hypothetical protein